MTIDPSIFRDYDIRALVPQQLDEQGIARIAQAIVKRFNPRSIQVGRDMRVSSPGLHEIFIRTMLDLGVHVVDLGLISTDMLYFAAGTYPEDMAVTISASHNPPQYNGLKIVKKGAVAVSGDSGIYDIRDLALSTQPFVISGRRKGKLVERNTLSAFTDHLLSFIDTRSMKPYKVVVDAGNGMAGHFMPELEKHLPWKVTRLYYELDGTFPNHLPNPLEVKNMKDVIRMVVKQKADVGMAFDGDGDRVFLVDESGRIISGTLMTAMISEHLLQKHPGETILYNAIIGKVVPEVISSKTGRPLRVRVGHTLIKEAMRKHNALFCGEHSGHYFFRENFFADSAIIAALLILELMSEKDLKLSQLIARYDKYPSSGEINFEVGNKQDCMKKMESSYQRQSISTDWLDGLTVWFQDWWFNLRPSNTEPLLRLNIEANDRILLEKHTRELKNAIRILGGKEKT